MKATVRIFVSAALTLACLAHAATAQDRKPGDKAAREGVEGYWLGPLKVGAIDLRIGFKVERKGDALSAKIDSPDQGAFGLKVDEVTFKERKLRLEAKMLAAVYEGELSKDGTELKGEWRQAASTLPLTLKRLEKEPTYARPQDPKRPYPYLDEEVSYENKKAKVKFGGTLTLPKGDGPFPAVLLITGSGPQDRNESILGHKPFLVIADHLTRKGIAVLRVDDRGVGKSTGSTMESTTADFADDALTGIKYLKSRKEIDPKRIGLIGHSEGGLVAPLAASKSGDVAFCVLLAGTGIVGEEILYLQGQLIAKAGGADEKALAESKRLQQLLFGILKEEKDPKKAAERIQEVVKKELEKLPDEKKKGAGGAMKAQLTMLLSPWFRYFLTYDPAPALRATKCPVLAVCGEKDLQVPPKENLAAIEKALKEGGNKDYTIREFPGLNHLFQTCKTGAPTEYAVIEETVAPAVLNTVSEWILKRFPSPAK
jgi:pimeloyl-ACP methyl ester carboxylesterase